MAGAGVCTQASGAGVCWMQASGVWRHRTQGVATRRGVATGRRLVVVVVVVVVMAVVLVEYRVGDWVTIYPILSCQGSCYGPERK